MVKVTFITSIILPLTQTTQKNIPWEWLDACQDAFDTLKSVFTSALILHHWSPDHIPLVEMDTSDYAIATVFSMTDPSNRIPHPVVFHSQTLTRPELNYDIHNKELLAIYEAFCVWRHYLEGSSHTINIVTNHKNLEYFSTTKVITWRQAQWSKFLSAFNLLICF